MIQIVQGIMGVYHQERAYLMLCVLYGRKSLVHKTKSVSFFYSVYGPVMAVVMLFNNILCNCQFNGDISISYLYKAITASFRH